MENRTLTDVRIPELEEIRSRLYLRLINRENAGVMLEDMPHRDFMDLTVTCYFLTEEGEHTVIWPVLYSCLRYWGIREEDVFRIARENAEKAQRPMLERLDFILPVCGRLLEEMSPLLVLTLEDRPFGAVCITDPEILEKAAKKAGGSYYILPSSVHECLILPDTGEYVPEELNEMVRNINRTEVLPREVLSDHVYRYEASERKLSAFTGHT